jgi:hypothetical protein
VSREISFTVGVIAEKRAAASRWAADYWIPVGVTLAPIDRAAGDILLQDERVTRYFMGSAEITCYAADMEAYVENFDSGVPALYVVLRRDAEDAGPLPWYVQCVTVSPHEAQDYEVGASDLVERVAMPPEIEEPVRAFMAEHYRPQEFRKRKRNEVRQEEQLFGKEPIFSKHPRRPEEEADG